MALLCAQKLELSKHVTSFYHSAVQGVKTCYALFQLFGDAHNVRIPLILSLIITFLFPS